MKPIARISAAAFSIVLLASAVSVAAKPKCRKQPIKNLVEAFAESFANKTMGTLDADRPYVRRFRIVIEHSLAGDNEPGRFVTRWFRSLTQAENWLKRREHDGMPGRATKPLEKCARGVCTYNFESGILHNTLFLKRVTYGVRTGCPYLKTIYLLDGD